jgi:exodeoxyribonuclease V alpha subunit
MKDKALFSRIDFAFSDFLTKQTKLTGEEKKRFKVTVARLSNARAQGHSCITVNEEDKLNIMLSGVADGSGFKPLVIEEDTLYLQRYWQYESQLSRSIVDLVANKINLSEPQGLLDQYFSLDSNAEIDWQKHAAKTAITNRFTIITGGPGTGKTTTVVKILALLQELSNEKYLNIALVAPTGKAAMRLKESILKSKVSLNSSSAIKDAIPVDVQTIHRLLGVQKFSPYFKYGAEKKLPFDLLVIDEASMIDLPLMAKLLSALTINSRVIILGDKDQLASVETGSILADLSLALPKNTVELKKSYRFSGNIKKLAVKVNRQEGVKAWQLIDSSKNDVSLLSSDLISYIVDKQDSYLDLIKNSADFKDIYTEFNCFQVLCATRRGGFSIEDINNRVVNKLRENNRIKIASDWYIGRPILITQNSPALDLYNGDIGICLFDESKKSQLVVCFLMPDGKVKKYLPARLPHCETVFAMTIHKSQGAEFDEVLLVLPEKITPILTKELIYTGVTRAKNKVQVVSSKSVFIEAVNRKVERNSGLIKRISK